MKKVLFVIAGVLITMLSFSLTALSQVRFDIAMEGPWIFYRYPSFDPNDKTKIVLVAIAPQANNHLPPVFTTGDLGQMKPGIYCLGVSDDGNTYNCAINGNTLLQFAPYADPRPVAVYKPTDKWDYTTVTAVMPSYVIILPMPDLYSADGLEEMDFESDYPTPNNPTPTVNEDKFHAIGAHLHYNTGGHTFFQLLSCSGTPSPATCAQPMLANPQLNSGTLRITMKNNEDPNDTCDYHVHGAYNQMLHLLDPNLDNANNKLKAYTGVKKYSSCSTCDPQNPNHQDCIMTTMAHVYGPPQAPDIPKALANLVEFLQALNLSAPRRATIKLPELSSLSAALAGKFPTESTLVKLESQLEESEEGAGAILLQLDGADAANDKLPQSKSLEVAVEKEKALGKASVYQRRSATNGKDCRAGTMLVQ